MIPTSTKIRAGLFLLLLVQPVAGTESLSAQNPGAAASTFSGKVIDASTGEPITGASVYIAGSTSGSSTDESGRYSFSTQLTGNHYLVFSLIGYKTQPHSIELKANKSYTINARLEPAVIRLEEVEVVSSNKEWRQDFKYFQKQFIGTTEFAKETKINNPWVIDFKREGTILEAFSGRPILVSNLALGYQIRIELVQFKWNTKTDLGVYKVFCRYGDIEANNEQQKQKWHLNRIKTFLGSKTHFFRSLYRGEWKENNYSLGYEDDLQQLTENDLKYYFLTASSPYHDIPPGWKAFKLENYLSIRYRKFLPAESGSPNKILEIEKTSGIESNRKHNIFFINKWGLLRDVASVYLHGLWGKNRIANSLPNNYTFESLEIHR